MPQRLTADVDAWAVAHDTIRSDAIRQLVAWPKFHAIRRPPLGPVGAIRLKSKNLAVEQIGRLLDPSLPIAERERRIRRLTEGPPEFQNERIDLPLRE
jgi:hypothetical protein